MTLTAGGSLGIGTTSVSRLLHVAQANSTAYSSSDFDKNYQILRLNNTTDDKAVGLEFQIGTNGQAAITAVEISDGTTDLCFGTRGGGYRNEKVRIDANGRLLVGTSSARSNVDHLGVLCSPKTQVETVVDGRNIGLSIINNSIYAPVLTIGGTGAGTGGSIGQNTLVSNGRGLGVLAFAGADGTNLLNAATIDCQVDGTPGANDMPGRLVFSTTADGASSPTERMRITNNGNVFINSTSNPAVGTEMFGVAAQGSGQIIAAGFLNTVNTAPTVFVYNSSNTTNTYLMRFASGSSGNTRGEIYYNGSQLVYATSSDYRLKENVVSFENGAEIVKRLRPVRYNWIENGNEDIGFIAHEVQAVFPNAVGGEKDAVDDDGKILPQTYDPSKLVPLLTAALQEAIGEIESLKARVAALESV